MAKTASKNNPLSRRGQKEFKYKSSKISFTKVYDFKGKSFKTACYDENNTFVKENGKLLSWQSIIANN